MAFVNNIETWVGEMERRSEIHSYQYHAWCTKFLCTCGNICCLDPYKLNVKIGPIASKISCISRNSHHLFFFFFQATPPHFGIKRKPLNVHLKLLTVEPCTVTTGSLRLTLIVKRCTYILSFYVNLIERITIFIYSNISIRVSLFCHCVKLCNIRENV